ncbi:GDNF-inducible zinc finger protein 1 [Portunus trituberculatus]|uniref:GDNF-inducible zinc finger protein 1 n=1 Tax=Portunus trituberculatus TaxID=210409 RepID=A0A5B7FN82_PORTR|nr:GDNF-inducible zinc finger protein 1 [Portunus trituberculatus]
MPGLQNTVQRRRVLVAVRQITPVLGVPVGSAGTETLMIQSAPVSVDSTASSSGGNYSSGTAIQEPNSTQPVQYTALGSDVISLFSQVEANKESTSSDLSSEKTLPVVAKPLDCSVCAKSFAQKRTLWNHMLEAHPDLFCCSECCAAFTTSEYLTQHKAQHQKVHVCTKCGLAFTNKSSLNRHRQQTHSGVSMTTEDKFQVYVKDGEKCSAKEKKQTKSSGGASEKRSHRQEPASEAPWASRFITVESDLPAMKASIAQLSEVLLPHASGSTFSGFADGRVSVRLPPQVGSRCKGAPVSPLLRPFGGGCW